MPLLWCYFGIFPSNLSSVTINYRIESDVIFQGIGAEHIIVVVVLVSEDQSASLVNLPTLSPESHKCHKIFIGYIIQYQKGETIIGFIQFGLFYHIVG